MGAARARLKLSGRCGRRLPRGCSRPSPKRPQTTKPCGSSNQRQQGQQQQQRRRRQLPHYQVPPQLRLLHNDCLHSPLFLSESYLPLFSISLLSAKLRNVLPSFDLPTFFPAPSPYHAPAPVVPAELPAHAVLAISSPASRLQRLCCRSPASFYGSLPCCYQILTRVHWTAHSSSKFTSVTHK